MASPTAEQAREPSAPAEVLLELDRLDVRYGGVHAVQELSIRVGPGETVVLIGANGAGKSSVINAIMGLVPVAGGRIRYDGGDITKSSPASRARAGIRISPEGRRVFAHLSIEDNILSGGYTLSRARRNEALSWMYETFPWLSDRRRAPAGTLSGGQQQIVAIARALTASPRLLLLDEPFLGLSPVAIADTSAAIRLVRQRGMAVLISEQMARPALKLADRGHVLRTGTLRRSGTVAEIRELALSEDYL
ncbi:MAG TPA: ABC transporter ATP-binding protein [Actinoplanes sp.]|jgi:branched-chain amino acid transport system ATP-binding protein|nr:ABC transporter ATP-binding protein [Actinoplanes sp.]